MFVKNWHIGIHNSCIAWVIYPCNTTVMYEVCLCLLRKNKENWLPNRKEEKAFTLIRFAYLNIE